MYLDDNLTQSINALAGQFSTLDLFMRAISVGGPLLLVLGIAVRWWSRERREFQRHSAIACGLSTALALLFNQIILFFYQRPRPYESGLTRLIIERSTDPSFPSDHATVGFAITVCLLLRKDPKSFLFFMFSALLCFSRVYIGTHYVTDVIGGAITGALGAFIIDRIYYRFKKITERLIRVL